VNPLGIKRVGEIGITPHSGAVVNACDRQLGREPYGGQQPFLSIGAGLSQRCSSAKRSTSMSIKSRTLAVMDR
jgi:hypothetical protein